MNRYYLTRAAEADLRDIIDYTFTQWGEDQVKKYHAQIESRLESLAKFPDIGRKHTMLKSHIYYVTEGKHYIFYRITSDGIEILRFLHHRMDVIRYLSAYL